MVVDRPSVGDGDDASGKHRVGDPVVVPARVLEAVLDEHRDILHHRSALRVVGALVLRGVGVVVIAVGVEDDGRARAILSGELAALGDGEHRFRAVTLPVLPRPVDDGGIGLVEDG